MNKENQNKNYQELVYNNSIVKQSVQSITNAEKTLDEVDKLLSRAVGTLPALSKTEIFAPNEHGEFVGNIINIGLRRKELNKLSGEIENNFNLQESADEIQSALLGFIESNAVSPKMEDEIIFFGTEYIGELEDRANDIAFRFVPYQKEGAVDAVKKAVSEYLKPTRLKDMQPLNVDSIKSILKSGKMPNGDTVYDYYARSFELEHAHAMAKDFEKKKRPEEASEDYSVYSK